jgi:hypothetical protein
MCNISVISTEYKRHWPSPPKISKKFPRTEFFKGGLGRNFEPRQILFIGANLARREFFPAGSNICLGNCPLLFLAPL